MTHPQLSDQLVKRFASLVVGVTIIIIGVFLIRQPLKFDRTVLRINGGQTFVIDVADEAHERRQGLAERDPIGDREGMLFVYEAPGAYNFTMEGMRFDLDFIWITADKTVAEITSDVQHGAEPPNRVSPASDIQYVLEVKAGTAAELQWQPGMPVEFNVD